MLERLSAEVFGERRAAELQYRDLSQELVMANGSAELRLRVRSSRRPTSS